LHRKAILATVLTFTAMMLLAGIPLQASGDTHHVVKGAQGPRASSVRWTYAPAQDGSWTGHIVNSGLKSLVVDVSDITGGSEISIMHQRVRFAASGDVTETTSVLMGKDREYEVEVIPNGAKGTYCDIYDTFYALCPPVARFTMTALDALTIYVNGSTSYDPDNGTIIGWAWDFGDGTTGTGVTATHAYAAMGSYVVTLTVMDNDGLTSSASMWLPPPPPGPWATFTYAVLDYTVAVDASASTDGIGIVSYAWNWGDGTVGSGMMTSHTYLETGTYSISLTVANTRGQTASTFRNVSLVGPAGPVARFTCLMTSYNAIFFNASTSEDISGVIIAYAWDFGDGTTGSGMTVRHAYSDVAPRTIKLTVTDDVGQSNSSVRYIVPSQTPPNASFSVSIVGVRVNATAGVSQNFDLWAYTWKWADGTSTRTFENSATHTYLYGGTYPLTLTVVNLLLVASSCTQNVTIPDLPPSASFTLEVSGNSVYFSGLASTNDLGFISYHWDFGDGSFGTGPTERHTYASPGDYVVALRVTDELGQNSSVEHTLHLDGAGSLPVAALTWTYLPNIARYSVLFDASASTGDIISWDWSFGDWMIGSGVTHMHRFVFTGQYTVVLTVTDSHGLTSSATCSISATCPALPPLPFTVYGYTNASGGTTPLVGCEVSITCVRTGETLIGAVSDERGFYFIDNILPLIMYSGCPGDSFVLQAVGPNGELGWANALVDIDISGGVPYMQVDLTLT